MRAHTLLVFILFDSQIGPKVGEKPSNCLHRLVDKIRLIGFHSTTMDQVITKVDNGTRHIEFMHIHRVDGLALLAELLVLFNGTTKGEKGTFWKKRYTLDEGWLVE